MARRRKLKRVRELKDFGAYGNMVRRRKKAQFAKDLAKIEKVVTWGLKISFALLASIFGMKRRRKRRRKSR